jgi:hypothetical protein
MSKSETNSNDQNPNDLNVNSFIYVIQFLDVSSFEHLKFDIVSSLGFRISNFEVSIESGFHFKEKLNTNFKIFIHIDG